MHPTPGTVSKILWHFTGGPLWNCEKNCHETCPKPAQQVFDRLVSILRSRQLRTGSYREVVKVLVPKRKVRNPTTKQLEIVKDSVVTVESVPVCCLADIPIAARPPQKVPETFFRATAQLLAYERCSLTSPRCFKVARAVRGSGPERTR